MTIMLGDNMVLTMHYTLTDPQGNVLDSSENSEPLAYLHGANNIIPGLEKGLVGKTVDDQCQVTVAPEDGYGDVIPELVQTVDKAAFEGVETLQAGMAFEARSPQGEVQRVVITAIDGDQVTVDGNHPLAGITLKFDVKIISVRDATPAEIEQGSVH